MNEEDEAFEDLAKRQGDWGMQGSRKHQILRYAENVESKGTSTTQEEIDIMWQQAMRESIKDGQMYTRYHFAKLVAKRALAEHAMREVQQLGQEIEQEPVAKYCCRLCFNKSGSLLLDRMILCFECGNKRCPKATNHELQCTNSNAPNQAGSIYNTPPQPEQEPVAWPCLIDSADFSENTITLVMQCEDYKVSAGTHWLSTTPPQRTEEKNT
jgi:hypothetical protein